MTETHLRHQLRGYAARLLGNDARTRRFLQLGLVGGGVVLAGLSEALSNTEWGSAYKSVFITLWVTGLVLSILGTAFLAYVEQSPPELLIDAEKAIDEAQARADIIDRLEGDFAQLASLNSLHIVFREFVEQVALGGAGVGEEQAERLGDMLDVVVANKQALFGISDDRWGFAIYLLEDATGELVCAACRRPVRADETAEHRRWLPGQGHVGMSFQTRREIVARDTSLTEARILFDAPESQRRNDDTVRYRSIASLPIRMQDEAPIGVLVATSDIPGRFFLSEPDAETVRDPVAPLRLLAAYLALRRRTLHLVAQRGMQ